jgi:m7GpppX diphosphatase
VLNWLAIAHDRDLRTLRDLRGKHVPMLKEMLEVCLQTVEKETGIRQEQVMAYVHYPPSVYQLHVHFSFPYGQYCHRDAYRVHNLASVINNLEIDPDYYLKATLHMAVYRQSLHYAALTEPDDDDENNPRCVD